MNQIDQDEAEERQRLIDMSISVLKNILGYKETIEELQQLISLEKKNASLNRSKKKLQKLKSYLKSNQKALDSAYEVFDQYGARLDELDGYVEEPDEVFITPDDVVVKTYTFKCVKHMQKLIDVKILVDWAKDEISKKTELVAGKCPKCNAYYVKTEEVERANLDGILLCRLVDEDTYRSMINGSDPWNRYNPQSVLMQFGYSVSKEKGLTAQQRHIILSYIMDKEVCPPAEILSYLSWFIETREDKPQYATAIDKWKCDMEFVRNYKPKSQKQVILRIT